MRQNLRVLVVDDNELNRHLLTGILEDNLNILDPAVAKDGESAIRMIGFVGLPFDLVMVELEMSGTDGLDVVRAAKKKSAKTKVILCGAQSLDYIRERLYGARVETLVDGIIPKPIDVVALVVMVRSLLDL